MKKFNKVEKSGRKNDVLPFVEKVLTKLEPIAEGIIALDLNIKGKLGRKLSDKEVKTVFMNIYEDLNHYMTGLNKIRKEN